MIDALTYKPAFLILADGGPFASSMVTRIEIIDAAGFESDELTIELDAAVPIARPRTGAKFTVYLGYGDTFLTVVGTYVFEEIERSGFPRRVILRAKAADHAKTLKEPKTRAWVDMTVGDIIAKIAGEHNLKPKVAKSLSKFVVDYIAQTAESDQAFLTRLGKQIGAVIAPKDGNLVVTERRSGKKVSGKAMPTIKVTGAQLVGDDAYRVVIKPRSKFGKVIGRYHEPASGAVKSVTVKVADEGPSTTLQDVYPNEARAKQAAKARAKELMAGEGELELVIKGDPAARAECPLTVVGVDLDADGSQWITTEVRHEWDFNEGGGATTTISAEFGKPEESS